MQPHKVFGFGASNPETAQGLIDMQHGNKMVADYSIDFRIKASLSHWNSAALITIFLHGLADYLKDELVSHDVR